MQHPKCGLLHKLVLVDRKPDCEMHTLDRLEARHNQLEGSRRLSEFGITYQPCPTSRKNAMAGLVINQRGSGPLSSRAGRPQSLSAEPRSADTGSSGRLL